jgi:hypothetical protein
MHKNVFDNTNKIMCLIAEKKERFQLLCKKTYNHEVPIFKEFWIGGWVIKVKSSWSM